VRGEVAPPLIYASYLAEKLASKKAFVIGITFARLAGCRALGEEMQQL
jgi:hypothetical protein